jgi:ribosomal protein L40E
MKCEKCGSNKIRVWIEVQMYIDFEDYGKLSKRVIAKKSTEIWSMNDNKTKFICAECGYTK